MNLPLLYSEEGKRGKLKRIIRSKGFVTGESVGLQRQTKRKKTKEGLELT